MRIVHYEILDLATRGKAAEIVPLIKSVIAVTQADPGALAKIQPVSGIAQLVEHVFGRTPQSRENHITGLSFELNHVAICFNWSDKTFRVDDRYFVQEVTEDGLERSRAAQELGGYLEVDA